MGIAALFVILKRECTLARFALFSNDGYFFHGTVQVEGPVQGEPGCLEGKVSRLDKISTDTIS